MSMFCSFIIISYFLQPLAMKAVYCPIDTSLNFNQAKKLIRDLKPSCIAVPEQYTVPPAFAPTRTDLVIDEDSLKGGGGGDGASGIAANNAPQ